MFIGTTFMMFIMTQQIDLIIQNDMNVLCSTGFWLSIISSFFFGVLVKYLFNKVMSPKIVIGKYILPDEKTHKPYIKVCNKSFCKRNSAYDLHLYLTYYKGNIPIHTGFIRDGVMKVDSDKGEKYSITTKKKIDYDAFSPNCSLEVTLICRNRFGTYSLFEEKCCVDSSTIKHTIERK